MNEPTSSSGANGDVLNFYRTLPFNARASSAASTHAVKANAPERIYPVLAQYLKPGMSVLEVGSGVGWLSNAIAHFHKCNVLGIDFNPVAIESSRRAAESLELNTQFETRDLFKFKPAAPFDMVVSLGVLHHTNDCLGALRHLMTNVVRPGGYLFIGLYHHYGRKPLLDHFSSLRSEGATYDELFARYRQLHSELDDDVHAESWFRDQVLHPHETQHTLEELLPLLESCNTEIISTSINRYEPIESKASLVEQEKTYYDIGLERLKNNEYFTGFFVVLARKRMQNANTTYSLPPNFDADNKPYIEHHPVFGYHYLSNVELTLPTPMGHAYMLRTNSVGLRSDREYDRTKPAGITRILVLGDSMSAGQFVDNKYRFTELLERRNPGVEFVNLSLEGSGSDQQLLLYEHVGCEYEHDAVLFLPFLQNIRRNMVDARISYDPLTGEQVYLSKPKFMLTDDRLVLTNVPVSRKRIAVNAAEISACFTTDHRQSAAARAKSVLNAWLEKTHVKGALYEIFPREPFPEYKDPSSLAWQVMSALVSRLCSLAQGRPVWVVPTFYSAYTIMAMQRNYLDRFRSIREPNLEVVDLLPDFRQLGAGSADCFNDPFDCHFSRAGHVLVADVLEKRLKHEGLI
jgi:2-polyprenyl-3-methyl-5-hydroxy-6-metoxy-1,4-benzoquinol methylase